MLLDVKAKTKTGEDMNAYFGVDDHTPIIPIDDMEGDQEFTRLVMIPQKWAADIIDRNPTPYAFFNYVHNHTKDWDADAGEYHDYLLAWAVAACTADNKTTGKTRSQLHTPLIGIDGCTDALEEWADAHLTQTLGIRGAGRHSLANAAGDT